VVVRDAAISSKMHFRERVRETLLTRAVLERHPAFSGNVLTYGGTDEPTEDRPYTIEGGDLIVLSPEAVLVGASERTRSETIELLAGKCFQYGHVERVYEIPIPADRSFMHLDTVFTVVDRGVVLWYPDVMERVEWVHRYEPSGESARGVCRVPESRSFHEILSDEFGIGVQVIQTAAGCKHFGPREQRTDGTNALAIAPRLVVKFARNERTRAALESQGITCIAIDDSELVRGLGGPRCMTMPIRRGCPA
jgi:arginine deiminase